MGELVNSRTSEIGTDRAFVALQPCRRLQSYFPRRDEPVSMPARDPYLLNRGTEGTEGAVIERHPSLTQIKPPRPRHCNFMPFLFL
jgi:hypothetical protein